MPEPTPPIESKELKDILEGEFSCPIFLRDRTNSFVSEGSLLAVSRHVLKSLERRGIAYAKNFDCDDFCLRYLSEVSISHAMTSDRSQGIAVGFLFYVDAKLGPHARIWFATKDLEIKFIEPQSAEIVKLSKKEKETAWIVFG